MAENYTRVFLLETPLDNDYQHTMYFPNKQAQETWMSGKIQHYFDDSNYQRKDNVIKVPKHYDEIQNCNYVMYRNQKTSQAGTNDKWYYCFIKEMKYISEGVTQIIIETDVIQTWLFDYFVHPSFVEREHVAVDNMGRNTYPENVELGTMVCNNPSNAVIKWGGTSMCYIVGSTYNPSTGSDVSGRIYNGVYSGVGYFKYQTSAQINSFLQQVTEDGKMDAITGIFLLPAEAVNYDGTGLIPESTEPRNYSYSVDMPSTVDGYTPRNKKLLTYPYSYLVVNNGAGSNAIYHYEDFNSMGSADITSTSCQFQYYLAIAPSGSTRLVPKNYKKIGYNYEEGLTGPKYPICNYAVDMYTNWLTQNAVNENIGYEAKEKLQYIQNGMNGLAGLVGAIGSIFTLNGEGFVSGANTVSNSVSGVMNTMSQKYQASLLPDQARGNMNSGDVSTSMEINCFHVYRMSIKREYAEMIDGFFDMYGYQVNQLKTPNTNHRTVYWYTKTINANISGGSIPKKDLDIIKRCYDNGITFWREGYSFRQYGSYPNDTITTTE